MITMRLDLSARHGPTANHHAIGGGGRIDAQNSQAVRHDLDAVALLDAQFLGTSESGLTLGTGRRDKEHRKLIDGQRDEFFRYVDTPQLAAANPDISHRLPAGLTRIQDFDVRSHQLENVDHSGPGRIDADMLQHDIRACRNGCADHEKRGGGNIAGHVHITCGQFAA